MIQSLYQLMINQVETEEKIEQGINKSLMKNAKCLTYQANILPIWKLGFLGGGITELRSSFVLVRKRAHPLAKYFP